MASAMTGHNEMQRDLPSRLYRTKSSSERHQFEEVNDVSLINNTMAVQDDQIIQDQVPSHETS